MPHPPCSFRYVRRGRQLQSRTLLARLVRTWKMRMRSEIPPPSTEDLETYHESRLAPESIPMRRRKLGEEYRTASLSTCPFGFAFTGSRYALHKPFRHGKNSYSSSLLTSSLLLRLDTAAAYAWAVPRPLSGSLRSKPLLRSLIKRCSMRCGHV